METCYVPLGVGNNLSLYLRTFKNYKLLKIFHRKDIRIIFNENVFNSLIFLQIYFILQGKE